jgi:ABC-type maltose transport system permease subunit
MIPGEISIVPRFLLLSHFPWPTRDIPEIPFTGAAFPAFSFVGSYWGVILPAAFNAFNFLLFKGFFDTIPDELIDAARMDGASEVNVFTRIMLPLALPIVAVTVYHPYPLAIFVEEARRCCLELMAFCGSLVLRIEVKSSVKFGVEHYLEDQGRY